MAKKKTTTKKEESKKEIPNPASKEAYPNKSTADKLCIKTINYKTLVDYLKAKLKKDSNFTLEIISTVCGCSFKYKTVKEIPEKDLKCKCGNIIITHTEGSTS